MKKLYLLAIDHAPTIFLCSIVGIIFIMAIALGVNISGLEFGR